MVGMILFGVKVFYKILRVEYPSLVRWFHQIHELPILKDILGEFRELDVPVPTLVAKVNGED